MTIFDIIGILGWVFIASFPFLWYKRRQIKRLRVETQRAIQEEFASRICAVCDKAYGGQVLATHYAQPYEAIEIGGKSVTRAVILHCPHCDHIAVHDPQGKVLPGFVCKYREISNEV